MAKKSKKQNKSEQYNDGPWMSMRTGLIVIAILSIGMSVLIAWNAVQTQGLVNGILWGLAYGLGIWGVFAIALLFNRFVRGKRN